jgi:hypothetical protein
MKKTSFLKSLVEIRGQTMRKEYRITKQEIMSWANWASLFYKDSFVKGSWDACKDKMTISKEGSLL